MDVQVPGSQWCPFTEQSTALGRPEGATALQNLGVLTALRAHVAHARAPLLPSATAARAGRAGQGQAGGAGCAGQGQRPTRSPRADHPPANASTGLGLPSENHAAVPGRLDSRGPAP